MTVNLIYGSGTQSSRKIFLQKDESVDRVEVQSEQFSQEVELGNSATFDLTLELFSGTTDTYKLEVVGLPTLTLRLVAHEATHVARFDSMPNFADHPGWYQDGIS